MLLVSLLHLSVGFRWRLGFLMFFVYTAISSSGFVSGLRNVGMHNLLFLKVGLHLLRHVCLARINGQVVVRKLFCSIILIEKIILTLTVSIKLRLRYVKLRLSITIPSWMIHKLLFKLFQLSNK